MKLPVLGAVNFKWLIVGAVLVMFVIPAVSRAAAARKAAQ